MIVTTVLVGATHDIHIQGSDLVVAVQLLQIEIFKISCAFKKSWIFGIFMENEGSVLRFWHESQRCITLSLRELKTWWQGSYGPHFNSSQTMKHVQITGIDVFVSLCSHLIVRLKITNRLLPTEVRLRQLWHMSNLSPSITPFIKCGDSRSCLLRLMRTNCSATAR